MDKKLKIKWLKALRSGRYKQGIDGLKTEGHYCCLGVLANIQGAKWVEGVPYLGKQQMSAPNTPEGFLRPCFSGLKKSTQKTLADMNDGRGCDKKSFKQIADYIEKRL